MRVDFLYLEGCPNHVPALERIKEILREESCGAEVREILVPDVQANRTRAEGLRFHVPQIFGGLPSHKLIRTAVRSALLTEVGARRRR